MGLPDEIREKIAHGQLPVTRPATVWAGFASPATCVACGDSIERRLVRYEFETPDRGLIAFHVGCFSLWETEILRP